jgi:hypothetical protein
MSEIWLPFILWVHSYLYLTFSSFIYEIGWSSGVFVCLVRLWLVNIFRILLYLVAGSHTKTKDLKTIPKFDFENLSPSAQKVAHNND